jgi:hypothetical protein
MKSPAPVDEGRDDEVAQRQLVGHAHQHIPLYPLPGGVEISVRVLVHREGQQGVLEVAALQRPLDEEDVRHAAEAPERGGEARADHAHLGIARHQRVDGAGGQLAAADHHDDPPGEPHEHREEASHASLRPDARDDRGPAQGSVRSRAGVTVSHVAAARPTGAEAG